jgi:hypothetical protein
MVIRLALLPGSDDAAGFDPEAAEIKALLGKLVDRLKDALTGDGDNPDEDADAVEEAVNGIVNWWVESAEYHAPLHFKREPQFAGLMEFFGDDHKDPARPTLNSMRNVDGEAGTFVRGSRRPGGDQ